MRFARLGNASRSITYHIGKICRDLEELSQLQHCVRTMKQLKMTSAVFNIVHGLRLSSRLMFDLLERAHDLACCHAQRIKSKRNA